MLLGGVPPSIPPREPLHLPTIWAMTLAGAGSWARLWVPEQGSQWAPSAGSAGTCLRPLTCVGPFSGTEEAGRDPGGRRGPAARPGHLPGFRELTRVWGLSPLRPRLRCCTLCASRDSAPAERLCLTGGATTRWVSPVCSGAPAKPRASSCLSLATRCPRQASHGGPEKAPLKCTAGAVVHLDPRGYGLKPACLGGSKAPRVMGLSSPCPACQLPELTASPSLNCASLPRPSCPRTHSSPSAWTLRPRGATTSDLLFVTGSCCHDSPKSGKGPCPPLGSLRVSEKSTTRQLPDHT